MTPRPAATAFRRWSSVRARNRLRLAPKALHAALHHVDAHMSKAIAPARSKRKRSFHSCVSCDQELASAHRRAGATAKFPYNRASSVWGSE